MLQDGRAPPGRGVQGEDASRVQDGRDDEGPRAAVAASRHPTRRGRALALGLLRVRLLLPEPEENYAHRANRAASPGGGPPERWPKSTTTRKRALKRDAAEGSAPPRYDRDAAGTFPPRVLRNWTERFGRMRAMPEGSMDDPERAPGGGPETGTAFGWVPADASEAAHFVRPRTAELPVRETTSAALETFDDPELEPAAELIRALARGEGPEALALIETRLRSPAEEPGEASGAPGVGAASRYFTQHGEFAWAPCRVLSYDAEARLFEIAWTADLGVKKRVKRLNLVFDAESKGAFRTRLANATTLRDAHEARLRYFSLVERMTFDGDVDAVLTPEWVDRVCEKSGRGVVRKRLKASLEAVVDEIRREYARSIKRSVLDLTLADGEAAKRVKRDVNVAPVEPPARVPEVGVADPREGLREEGATAPSEPFALKVSFVEALLPTADAGYLAALQKVYRDLDARDAALLPRPDDPDAFPPAQPMTLRELETFQRSKLEETASTVAENLVVRVCATVTELEEKTREAAITAEDPKARDAHLRALDRMPRFVNQLHLTVVDQLRTVVTNACASAKSFWTESFGGGDAAKEASERHAFHTPLLRVTLVAADGEVRFDPPLETVRDTVLAVFDDAVRAAEGLEDIRGRLAARRAAADPLLTDAERASVARPLMKPLGEWPGRTPSFTSSTSSPFCTRRPSPTPGTRFERRWRKTSLGRKKSQSATGGSTNSRRRNRSRNARPRKMPRRAPRRMGRAPRCSRRLWLARKRTRRRRRGVRGTAARARRRRRRGARLRLSPRRLRRRRRRRRKKNLLN